jgi:hypothetical protein
MDLSLRSTTATTGRFAGLAARAGTAFAASRLVNGRAHGVRPADLSLALVHCTHRATDKARKRRDARRPRDRLNDGRLPGREIQPVSRRWMERWSSSAARVAREEKVVRAAAVVERSERAIPREQSERGRSRTE